MAFDRFKNLAVLAEAVGLYFVGKTQSGFRSQGRGGIRWLPRSVPNRIGILLDLQQGKVPPERRWEARPAGIDTGRLRSSIAYQIRGNSVVVGTNLPYASDVQKGSSKSITIDRGLRHALVEWIRGLAKSRQDQAWRSFSRVTVGSQFTATVPPRPFLVLTDEDRRTINDMARKFFSGGTK